MQSFSDMMSSVHIHLSKAQQGSEYPVLSSPLQKIWFNYSMGRPRKQYFFKSSQVVLMYSQSWEASWRVSWMRECPTSLLANRVFPRAVPKQNTFQHISCLSLSLIILLYHHREWQNWRVSTPKTKVLRYVTFPFLGFFTRASQYTHGTSTWE